MNTPKTTDTTQTSQVILPDWVNAGAQANIATANKIATIPFQNYGGELAAPTSANTNAAPGTALAGVDQANAGYNTAAQVGAGAIGGPLPQVIPKTYDPGQVQKYMNPFLNNVVSGAMSDLERQRQNALTGISDSAVSAGAFGGSRQGVAEGVTNAESSRAAGIVSGQLRSQAFDTASGLQEQDIGAQNTASAQNQAAALQRSGQGLSLAQMLSSNATAGAANALGAADLQNKVGLAQQSAQQTLDQARQAEFMRRIGYPTEKLNTSIAALGMSPYGKTTTGTGTSTTQGGDNPFLTGVGAFGALGSLFSDPKLKKNVKLIAEDVGPHKVDLHQFQYKKEFLKTPMGAGLPATPQIGLLASDVQKKVPAAVKTVPLGNGKKAKAVNYPMALGHPMGGVFKFGRAA